ncbi:MAG: hypothetical protein QM778_29980 [Myxococcales bacterium]
MTSLRIQTIAFTLTFLLFGCDKGDEAQKGAVGESCQRRDDCGGGLACLDNRCVTEGSSSGDAGAEKTTSGGKLGESCTRRADCQPGLGCFGQVCTEDKMLTDAGALDTRSVKGESCRAANDCVPGLACVNQICRQEKLDLTPQVKQCFQVDCATAADCCVDWEPYLYTVEECAGFKTTCDASPASGSCTTYQNYCVCPQTCRNELCVAANCTTNANCLSPSRPFCQDQQCVQCKTTVDCAAYPDTQCVSGLCVEGCKHNEECGYLEACMNGDCVDVGCTSDRQCAFATGVPNSKCVNKECVTPCQTDVECAGNFGNNFNVCSNGQCKFVGCETDEECRPYLHLQNQDPQDPSRAVCKMPTKM